MLGPCPDLAVSPARTNARRHSPSPRPRPVARRLAGISREYVRQLEAGAYDPTLGALQKIAKALGVPLIELLQ